MTRPNQGLSSLALGGEERETLGTRLLSLSSVKADKSGMLCPMPDFSDEGSFPDARNVWNH